MGVSAENRGSSAVDPELKTGGRGSEAKDPEVPFSFHPPNSEQGAGQDLTF